MKKLIYLMILSLLMLTGCNNKKREELLQEKKEITCEKAEIIFTLNGLWEVEESKEINNTFTELSACHSETGTRIIVMHKNLENNMGDSILRLEDYIEAVKENLKISEEYNYSVGETTKTILYGKEYDSFTANAEKLNARQQFYMKKKDNELTIIIISLYGEDKLKDVLELGKKE